MGNRFARDNISGNQSSGKRALFLFPGMVIQWFMYMCVGSRGYGRVRQNTRLARSPIMTYVYSTITWGFLLLWITAQFVPSNSVDAVTQPLENKTQSQQAGNENEL